MHMTTAESHHFDLSGTFPIGINIIVGYEPWAHSQPVLWTMADVLSQISLLLLPVLALLYVRAHVVEIWFYVGSPPPGRDFEISNIHFI